MISGFVVSYNREAVIETCLRSIRFVDELIVVDKSSTDGSAAIARRYADRVVTVPWSPNVEETRALAYKECKGDFIVFLDDDECLSPEAMTFLKAEAAAPSADLYVLPCRHHILGRHDERAYYWPEAHVRAFRRGALEFMTIVHGGLRSLSENIRRLEPETGICFHNISHADTHEWIAKANRYTSIRDRNLTVDAEGRASPVLLARRCIEHYAGLVPEGGDVYLEAVAVLRALYTIIDGIKDWEQEQEATGAEMFDAFCLEMRRAYDALEAATGLRTGAEPPPATVS